MPWYVCIDGAFGGAHDRPPVLGARGPHRPFAGRRPRREQGDPAAPWPHEKLVFAEISCSVDLDPQQRGVHMSRFPELFEQTVDQLVMDEALLVEELAEHIATAVAARQKAERAEVEVSAHYPIQRETPVTRMRTQEMVSLIGIAAASETGTRRVIGVEATGINACPCAQGLV